MSIKAFLAKKTSLLQMIEGRVSVSVRDILAADLTWKDRIIGGS